MPRCYLGLGGNVGDVPAVFRSTLQDLAAAGVSPLQISPLFLTAPVGPQAGSPYHNACVVVETSLQPRKLLKLVQQLEDAAGRVRDVRWGERTLDIDLLACGDVAQSDAELTLPHPGLIYRRFVLDPLSELAPDWRHPVLARTLIDLQQRLRRRPLPILIAGGDDGLRSLLCAQLRDRFPHAVRGEVEFTPALTDPTILLLDDVAPEAGGLIKDAGGIYVRLDPSIAAQDPLAAAIAVVTAMLDEPQVVGELNAKL